jgi:hypothetical protein
MLNDVREYLRVRPESWRLRAEGLRAGRLRILRQADTVEQMALTALRRASSFNEG